MKKILFLGGAFHQIPPIEYAHKHGYYTILCDYLPDNPGQHTADKYYCVSTTDMEAILKVATKENIDGIIAYASDPAAPTAAYVAEKLLLPTNPYKSVEILSYKDKFRQFLQQNGFNCPKAKGYSSLEVAKKELNQFTFPVMVKPVDSSGSKGVSKVEKDQDFDDAFNRALGHSRSKRIIVEEFIVMDHEFMVAGDCFVVNGKVKFWGLLNSHRDKNVGQFVPAGMSFPIIITKERLQIVTKEIQRLFDLLDIKLGAFNIEIMFDKQNNLYFIEMGARNGGNMIPDLLLLATGEDMIAATIESAVGNRYIFRNINNHNKYVSINVLYSPLTGLFKEIKYKNKIKNKIIREVLYKTKGDTIQYFDCANKAIGLLFLEFDTMKEMSDFMKDPGKWIDVVVKQVIS